MTDSLSALNPNNRHIMNWRPITNALSRPLLLALMVLMHWNTQAQTVADPAEQTTIAPAVKPPPAPVLVKNPDGTVTEIVAPAPASTAPLPITLLPTGAYSMTNGPAANAQLQPLVRMTAHSVDPEDAPSDPLPAQP